MNTLWTFGDSFTFGHGCRPDGPTSEYYFNYKKEGDDVWPNHLGKLLNTKVKNFGKCGASNDFIIDSIINNWNNIKEEDYVIIGTSFYNRFDVPIKNESLKKMVLSTMHWQFEDLKNFNEFEKEKMETLVNFDYYFADNELYKKRHLKRFNFLEKLLKEKKTTTFTWNVNFIHSISMFEKISDTTNDEIKDDHFSFKGHKDFADMLHKKIVNPTLI